MDPGENRYGDYRAKVAHCDDYVDGYEGVWSLQEPNGVGMDSVATEDAACAEEPGLIDTPPGLGSLNLASERVSTCGAGSTAAQNIEAPPGLALGTFQFGGIGAPNRPVFAQEALPLAAACQNNPTSIPDTVQETGDAAPSFYPAEAVAIPANMVTLPSMMPNLPQNPAMVPAASPQVFLVQQQQQSFDAVVEQASSLAEKIAHHEACSRYYQHLADAHANMARKLKEQAGIVNM
jgi:hypothetical protein